MLIRIVTTSLGHIPKVIDLNLSSAYKQIYMTLFYSSLLTISEICHITLKKGNKYEFSSLEFNV